MSEAGWGSSSGPPPGSAREGHSLSSQLQGGPVGHAHSLPTYPVTEPLDVTQPGDPLGGVDVGGVGAAVVYLRGHLARGRQAVSLHLETGGHLTCHPRCPSTHICMQGHLTGHEGQVAVRHNLGHTGVHEALHVWGRQGAHTRPRAEAAATLPALSLTFPALQRHQVALVVQGGDDHMDEVELALPRQQQGSPHGAQEGSSRTGIRC